MFKKIVSFSFKFIKFFVLAFFFLIFPLGIAVGTGFCWWLQTLNGQTWAAQRVSEQLTSYLQGRFHLDRLNFSVPGTFEVEGLKVVDDSGRVRVELPKLMLHASPFDLIQNHINIQVVKLTGLAVYGYQAPAGNWLISDVFTPRKVSVPSSKFQWNYKFDLESFQLVGASVQLSGRNNEKYVTGKLDLLADVHVDANTQGTYRIALTMLKKGYVNSSGSFALSPSLNTLHSAKINLIIDHLNPLKMLTEQQFGLNEAKKKALIKEVADSEIELSTEVNLEWQQTLKNSKIQVANLHLLAFGGQVTGQATLNHGKLYGVTLQTTDLNLAKFPWRTINPDFNVNGNLKLTASGEGTLENPKISARVNACAVQLNFDQSLARTTPPDLAHQILANNSCLNLTSNLTKKNLTVQVSGVAFSLPILANVELQGNLLTSKPRRYETRIEIQKVKADRLFSKLESSVLKKDSTLEASFLSKGDLHNLQSAEVHFNVIGDNLFWKGDGGHRLFLAGESLKKYSLLQAIVQKKSTQIASAAMRIIPPSSSQFAFPVNYTDLKNSRVNLEASLSRDEGSESKNLPSKGNRNFTNADSLSVAVRVSGKLENQTVNVMAALDLFENQKLTGQSIFDLEAKLPSTPDFSVVTLGNTQFNSQFRANIPDLSGMAALSPAILSLKGSLSSDVRWQGSLKNPNLQGDFRIVNASFIPENGPSFEKISLHLKATQTTVELVNFDMDRGGKIKAHGLITGLQWQNLDAFIPQFSLNVNTEMLKLDPLQKLSPTVASEIFLSGKLNQSGVLDAKLNVAKLEIYIPILLNSLPKQGQNLKLPDGVKVVRLGSVAQVPSAPQGVSTHQGNGASRSLVNGVHLQTLFAKGIQIKGSDVQLDFQSNMTVDWNAQRTFLSGLTVLRRKGFVKILGKQFDIQKAQIEYRGQNPNAGVVNVEVTQKSDVAVAQLTVAGTVSHPDIRLTSDPALPEKDIAALMITGSTASGVLEKASGRDEEKSSKNKAASFAANAVANKLAAEIFGTVMQDNNLVLSVDVKDSEKGNATIGVGRYVTDRLFMSIDKTTGSDGRENDNEVNFDYTLSPEWSLKGAMGDRSNGSLDILWKKKL